MHNDQLTITSGQFNVLGNGVIGLATNDLRYHVMLVYTKEDKQTRIPLIATGSLNAPHISLDKQALLKIVLEERAKQALGSKDGKKKFDLKKLFHKK